MKTSNNWPLRLICPKLPIMTHHFTPNSKTVLMIVMMKFYRFLIVTKLNQNLFICPAIKKVHKKA